MHTMNGQRTFLTGISALLLAASAALHAVPFTHNSGAIRAVIGAYGVATDINWPQSSADHLFNMDFILGVDGVAVSDGLGGVSAQAGAQDRLDTEADGGQTSHAFFLAQPGSGRSLRVESVVRTFPNVDLEARNVMEFQYIVTNAGSSAIETLYLGHYFDFDMGTRISDDRMGFDQTRRLFLQKDESGTWVGLRVVSGTTWAAHFRRFGETPFSRNYEGISTQGGSNSVSGATDCVFTMSQRFTSIAPNASVTYTLGVFFGDSVEAVQSLSDRSYTRNSGDTSATGGLTYQSLLEGPPPAPATSSSGGCLVGRRRED